MFKLSELEKTIEVIIRGACKTNEFDAQIAAKAITQILKEDKILESNRRIRKRLVSGSRLVKI